MINKPLITCLNFMQIRFKLKGNCLIKACLALIALVLLNSSCGKRVPPQPPIRQPLLSLSGFQKGNKVFLSWQSPKNAVKVNIYRLIEPLNSPDRIDEQDFTDRSVLIASIEAKFQSYQDVLRFSDQQVRIYYAVRFVNSSGQQGAISRVFSIEPSGKVPIAPTLLSAQVFQEKISIKWLQPEKNIDDSKPANLVGYNLYRIEKDSQKLLNRNPIKQETFDDTFFEFEKAYKYIVRAVAVNKNGDLVESDDSNVIEIVPKDTFPPKPPEGVTIAASPNSISIFFAANRESDVIGYLIFRSQDQTLPLDKWEKITLEPVKTNTFQDKNVKSGLTYFYFVKAVDKFGNISEPSEIVSEMVP